MTSPLEAAAPSSRGDGGMLRFTPRPSSTTVSEGELKLELLLDLGKMISREVDLDALLRTFGERVAAALGAQRATLWLLDAATGEIRSRVANLPELDELRLPVGRGVAGHVARRGEVVNIRDATADPRWAPEIDQRTGFRTTSMLCVPVTDGAKRMRAVVQVLNKEAGAFSDADEAFALALAGQIARALDYTSLRAADRPRGVPVRGRFNHIVGASEGMEEIYALVSRAAQTDATVLLRGETGTGKGLFARAIHVNSKRQAGPLVHVDCTTLPAALVESELFGHERGAYTGADARVLGKVELADGGTLFLDEIGELPLALQGKLLRFVQDRKFERVGGRETRSADTRLIAATHRDLAAMVAAGTFRADLYYRLRVIELELPPLRARAATDLTALADHFLTIYGQRYGREALRFGDEVAGALAAHRWPGNVRELEHAVERAVVLSDGPVIGLGHLGLDQLGRGQLGRDQLGRGQLGTPPPSAAADRSPTSSVGADDASAAPEASGDGGAHAEVHLPAGLSLDEASERYARDAVRRADGNQSAAARSLAIGRNRLARLLK